VFHCLFEEINVFKAYSAAFFRKLTELMRIALFKALHIALINILKSKRSKTNLALHFFHVLKPSIGKENN
jgi:hypothetical protein